LPKYAIIQAPSVLGHIPSHLGVGRMPEFLLGLGLAEELSARRARRVESPPYHPGRDPDTQIMNPGALHEYSIALADSVEEVLDVGEFPIVLGGDCSILLGSMLALKRRGRSGLLYIDGHADFYQPEANPISGAASASDLAFATGRGPGIVTDLEHRGPLVRDDDVVLFGDRSAAAQVRHRCQPLPSDFLVFDRDQVRRLGADAAVEEAVDHLTREGGPAGYWIHVDVDVLDPSIMAAVDDPLPDGFSWDEFRTVLRIAATSQRALGAQFTIYNPDMDGDGTSGKGLVASIVSSLAQHSGSSAPNSPTEASDVRFAE
jgi:arginase